MGMAIVEFGVFSWNKGHSSLNDKYIGEDLFLAFFGHLSSVCVCRCVFFTHRLAKKASNIGHEPR